MDHESGWRCLRAAGAEVPSLGSGYLQSVFCSVVSNFGLVLVVEELLGKLHEVELFEGALL